MASQLSKCLNVGLFLMGLGLILFAVEVPTSFADEPKSTGSLSGRLIDFNGRAVNDVRVAIGTYDLKSRAQKSLAETRTDGEGRFRFQQLEPFASNRFAVSLDVDGFARISFPAMTLTVYDGADNDLGTIRADLGRIYTGSVVDIDAKPRADADVVLSVVRHEMGHTVSSILSEVLKTDEFGRFRTPPLPIGRLGISIRVPDRRLAHVSKPVEPGGEEDLGLIQLEIDSPFHGIIQDEEGRGIPDVEIGGTVGHTAKTDEQGRFTLRGFAPDPTFQLNVHKEGLVSLVGRVTVKGNNVVYAIGRGEAGRARRTAS